MAQVNITDRDSNGAPYARKLGTFKTWTRVFIQVQGPETVFFGNIPQDLQAPVVNGRQGLQVTAANGLLNFWWIGDFWITASAPVAIEFQAVSKQ